MLRLRPPGFAVSYLGDGLVPVAIVVLAQRLSSSASLVGLAGAASTLPRCVRFWGRQLGAVIDRSYTTPRERDLEGRWYGVVDYSIPLVDDFRPAKRVDCGLVPAAALRPREIKASDGRPR